MDSMQEQMNAILGNPEMMQKIMAMAQALNGPSDSGEAPSPKQDTPLPDIDFGTLQRLSGLASQTNIDGNQRSLLKALSPYLSRERIGKLERAMRAARLASMASGFLGRSHSGR